MYLLYLCGPVTLRPLRDPLNKVSISTNTDLIELNFIYIAPFNNRSSVIALITESQVKPNFEIKK